MIMGLVLSLSITKENQIMTQYLEYCARDTLLSSGYYNSNLPYVELIISFIASIAVTGINALIAIWNLSKPNPRDALLREEAQRVAEWKASIEKQYGTRPASQRVTYGDLTGAVGGEGQTYSTLQPPAAPPPPFGSSQRRSSLASRPRDVPHVGPSVSRPLTPLLQEEYDNAGDWQGDVGGAGDDDGHADEGRYDLHEVDEEPSNHYAEESRSLMQEPAPFHPVGGPGLPRGAPASVSSTALLAARSSARPPPPPVFSGYRSSGSGPGVEKLLAPPSPLQGGAETTDDTVQL